MAQRFLERLHYRVDVVANGRTAIEAWRSGRYDLILMDCRMPELDGYAATREIRGLENGEQHIPIVALTAHAMKGDEEQCTAAGMDGYLSKPISEEQARRLPLGRRRALRPSDIRGAGPPGAIAVGVTHLSDSAIARPLHSARNIHEMQEQIRGRRSPKALGLARICRARVEADRLMLAVVQLLDLD